MSGYQEILTDPSYVGQIVTMAAPEMGNVGANAQDQESARPHAVGMVVRNVSPAPSNWRAEQSLDGYLAQAGVVGISGLDTRKLVRHLRTHGAQMGVVEHRGPFRGGAGRAGKNGAGDGGPRLGDGHLGGRALRV